MNDKTIKYPVKTKAINLAVTLAITSSPLALMTIIGCGGPSPVVINQNSVVKEKISYYYDSNGDIQEYTKELYNSEGNITEELTYNGDDTLYSRCVYTYDTDGNLIEYRTRDAADNLTEEVINTYVDGVLNKMVMKYFYASGNVSNMSIDNYNSLGKCTDTTYYSYEDTTPAVVYSAGKQEYIYNADNKLERYESYDLDENDVKTLITYTVYSYADGKNILRQTYDAGDNETSKRVYEYSNGNLNKATYYTYNGAQYVKDREYIYEYNSSGKITKKGQYEYIDESNNYLQKETVYEYSGGNLIKQTGYFYDQDGTLLSYEVEEITYY